MDLSKSVIYRGLELNGVTLEPGRVLRGMSIERVDYSGVDATGYTEKRAGSDGMHASDIYLGGRIVDMSGLIYATSLAEMFDFLHTCRSVFSPTSAYQDSPGDRGFLPMHFQQPTLDTTSFPGGFVPLYMNLRPIRPPKYVIMSDRQDSSKHSQGNRPTSIPWSATLLAKDPRVYVDPDQSIAVHSGSPQATIPKVAINRGDYETPFNIMLIINAAPGMVGEFRVWGLNGVDIRIKIENKANVVYRWFGDDRVLMTQDITGGVTTNPLALRMDLATFVGKVRKPMVPAQINPPAKPFSTPFHYTATVPLITGSRVFWSEAFA